MLQSFSRNAFVKNALLSPILALIAACGTVDISDNQAGGESDQVAQVDLRISSTPSANENYETLTSFVVPDTHEVGDKIFPYEGIGWENELVGYRLYLDERAVTDIFGKRTSVPVLHKVDYRSNYHDLADWGLDVLKVGPSLGIGGLGLYRDGELQRFGAAGTISVEVHQRIGTEASFTLAIEQVPLSDGKLGNVATTYAIATGSPLTWVTVKSDLPEAILATGLVAVPSGKRITNSNPTEKGDWRYIASWGDERSEVKDGLGMVLFFRDREARLMPTEKDTYALRFNSSNPTYAFAAVWEQGPMGISTEEEFIAWVDHQQAELNQ